METIVKRRFIGVMRAGREVSGTTTEPLLAFVEGCFRKRWQSLSMLDMDGREVGGITCNLDTGKRTWWAES